ncbi:kanadaptin isoform X1 [Anopheles aquasalis]|uniref:kanadaptin isoform X1 n=1 Tax=Anopheles aquasalis TaxID=42839 RepID=UPI00215AF77B|nr:kanadaptin isoform X1 [Anopheles aquasalis]
MTEKSEFKVPTIDPKVLAKGRKPDLPSSASKVNLPIPKPEELGNASTFETNTAEIPPIPYKEPGWSGKCHPDRNYFFEVEKNGVIIEKVRQLQGKPFWLFGRLPNCDLNLAHPTISRYHAVLQYRPAPRDASDSEEDEQQDDKRRSTHATVEPGWYLYDLNSTHGTFVNKQQIAARTYVRVRVGYMLKLGSSSRNYILQGPPDDEDEPSAMTITEIKEQTAKIRKLRDEMAEIERKERERIEKLKEEEGISWGMAEDADEETDLTENPYAASNNEELFLDDPKKTLRGYFEREGHELDYQVEELPSRLYKCTVELPIDDANGRPIVATATDKNKKKEAVVQCALEACRILDRHGLLRQANHEPRRRFKKQSDSDDDDEFLDRTGAVEERRKRKQTKNTQQVRSYEDLIREEANILERLDEIVQEIERTQLISKETRLPKNEDDVDNFLKSLVPPEDKFKLKRLRLEQNNLNLEHAKVKRLIEIAKPLDLNSIVTGKLQDIPIPRDTAVPTGATGCNRSRGRRAAGRTPVPSTIDSDDDDKFLDPTEAAEEHRKQKQTENTQQDRSYEDLIREEANILERLDEIVQEIERTQLISKETRLPKNEDDVDNFLKSLVPPEDKFKLKRLRLEQKTLTLEHEKVKKLIEIAKPLDLSSIVTGKLQESSFDDAQDKKRKMMLPLFGKRNKLSNTFAIQGSNIKAEKDTDVPAEGKGKDSKAGKASSSTEGNNDKKTTSKTVQQSTATESAEKSKHSSEPSPLEGRSTKKRSITGGTEESKPSKAKAEEEEAAEEETEAASSSRKKRPRYRTRGKVRDNVDIDDTEELASEDKNVEWVPPSGQTGDGRTSLNEKYGY